MRFRFKDDVAAQITEGLEENAVPKIGYKVAMRWRYYTYNHLSGTEWGDDIKENISNVMSTYKYSEFHIDHPTAYIHEFGGTVQGMKQVEAENKAFSWDSGQSKQASKSIGDSDGGTTIVPPKRFLRSAIEQTRKEMR